MNEDILVKILGGLLVAAIIVGAFTINLWLHDWNLKCALNEKCRVVVEQGK